MPIIVKEKIEVSDTETEIIEPNETSKEKVRTFVVSNGDEEIETKAWGSNDGVNWEERETTVIPANTNGTLTVGPTIYWVKLTGKTTTPGTTSIVDSCLVY